MKQCKFCIPNDIIGGEILHEDDLWYFVTSADPLLSHAGLIITKRHVETPFEINAEEWHRLHELLPKFKSFLDKYNPDGYNLGWNIGETGGQHVFHAHLHIMARTKDEPLASKGIRYAFREAAREAADVTL